MLTRNEQWASLFKLWVGSSFDHAAAAFKEVPSPANLDVLQRCTLAHQAISRLSPLDIAKVTEDGQIPMSEVVPRLSNAETVQRMTHADDEEFK